MRVIQLVFKFAFMQENCEGSGLLERYLGRLKIENLHMVRIIYNVEEFFIQPPSLRRHVRPINGLQNVRIIEPQNTHFYSGVAFNSDTEHVLFLFK